MKKKAKSGAKLEERQRFYDDLAAGTMDLSTTIRRMRKLTGMTQPEYAKIAGVAPRVLIDLERGAGNPTPASINRIARPFGLEVGLRHRAATEINRPDRSRTVPRPP